MPARRSAYVSTDAPTQSQLAMTAARLCIEFNVSPREAADLMGGVVSHQTIRLARELLVSGDAASVAAIDCREQTVHGVARPPSARTHRTLNVLTDHYVRLRALSRRSGVPIQKLAETALETYLSLAERAAEVDAGDAP